MPRDLERQTLDLVARALRRTILTTTPYWLIRPGREEAGPAWRKVRLIYRRLTNGLELPEEMPPRESRAVDAFPRRVWLEAAEKGRAHRGGGWAAPKPPLFPMAGGRNLQRAFRDALADLLPPLHGFAPTLRIADFEVRGWLYDRDAVAKMRRLLGERMETTPSVESGMSDG